MASWTTAAGSRSSRRPARGAISRSGYRGHPRCSAGDQGFPRGGGIPMKTLGPVLRYASRVRFLMACILLASTQVRGGAADAACLDPGRRRLVRARMCRCGPERWPSGDLRTPATCSDPGRSGTPREPFPFRSAAALTSWARRCTSGEDGGAAEAPRRLPGVSRRAADPPRRTEDHRLRRRQRPGHEGRSGRAGAGGASFKELFCAGRGCRWHAIPTSTRNPYGGGGPSPTVRSSPCTRIGRRGWPHAPLQGRGPATWSKPGEVEVFVFPATTGGTTSSRSRRSTHLEDDPAGRRGLLRRSAPAIAIMSAMPSRS